MTSIANPKTLEMSNYGDDAEMATTTTSLPSNPSKFQSPKTVEMPNYVNDAESHGHPKTRLNVEK